MTRPVTRSVKPYAHHGTQRLTEAVGTIDRTDPILPKRERPAEGPFSIWRRGAESNRPRRILNPLHNRFAAVALPVGQRVL